MMLGIILDIRKYGESKAIATIFMQKNGLQKAMVHGASSKTKRGIYQIGNIVEVQWRAKLEHQLGSFSCDMVYPSAANIMFDRIKLSSIQAICNILYLTLSEKEPEEELFGVFYDLLKNVNNNNFMIQYINFELNLLSALGYGLELDSCAATGDKDNLTYVSPKSGKAVGAEAGLPYADKLLKLPQFINANNDFIEYNSSDIKNGLELTHYFFNKYIFKPHNIKFPMIRTKLVEYL